MFLHSFRARLALLSGSLTLLAVAALAYPLGRMLSDEVLRDRGDALRGIAQGTALMLAEGLHERAREVQHLADAGLASGNGLDRATWSAEIERLKAGRPHYAWIGVADAAGTVVAASGGLLLGESVRQRPWFQRSLDGPFVGDVHAAKLLAALLPAPAGNEPLRFIDFAAPLRDRGGRTVGVLGVHADWRWAHDVIALVRNEDARNAGVRVFIVDREGRTIHHPAGPEAAQVLTAAETVSITPALRTGSDDAAYLGTSAALPARTPLTNLGWTVVVRQPAEVALRGVRQAQRAVWAAGAAAALAAILLGWLAAGHVARPLEEISAAAERIEAGDTGARIPLLRRASELQRLSQALSRMTQRLVARERALQAVNEALESRVAARTAELAQANVRLERLAHHDGLSGLRNRRSADELLVLALAQHRRHRRPLGVLMGDIDHFKRINDQFGHAAGDRVIQAVAACLQPHLRDSDVAARFGGEEFLVMLPETDAAGVVRVGEKLRAAVAALVVPGVGSFTMSLGGAVAERGRGDVATLLQRADAALYAAKHAGRNRVLLAAPETEDSSPVPLDAATA